MQTARFGCIAHAVGYCSKCCRDAVRSRAPSAAERAGRLVRHVERHTICMKFESAQEALRDACRHRDKGCARSLETIDASLRCQTVWTLSPLNTVKLAFPGSLTTTTSKALPLQTRHAHETSCTSRLISPSLRRSHDQFLPSKPPRWSGISAAISLTSARQSNRRRIVASS